MSDRPDLSVVLVSPDDFDTFRAVIGYLQAQTVAGRIEVVLVGSTPEAFRVDAAAMTGFHSHQVLHVGPIPSLSEPRVAGIRAARAPVVALTEDHCFPAETWAERLLHAHEGPYAAVGPTVAIANPASHRTWANALIQYGWWVPPTPSGVQDDIPGHNSSYKRDVLLEDGEDLETLFTFDAALHADLRRRGHRLYLDATAVTHHVYITQLRPFVQEHFHIGRTFAASRARDWPAARRWLYALASPALPVLRGWRIVRRMRELGWLGDLVPGVLPSLGLGLGASALGELLGYALGAGSSPTMTLDLDFRRFRFVSARERETIWCGRNVAFRADPPRPGRAQ